MHLGFGSPGSLAQGPTASPLLLILFQSPSSWEHLALTRARAMAGDATLAGEVEAFRRDLLARKGQGAGLKADVADMRARLATAKPGVSPWEAKDGTGKLMDIELCAQMLALQTATPARSFDRQLAAGRSGGNLSQTDETVLAKAARLFWRLHASARLLSDQALTPQDLGAGARAFLLRETDAADETALSEAVVNAAQEAAAVIAKMLR